MDKKTRAYAAEFLGTFLLALFVHVSAGSSWPVGTPVIAGLVLGMLVYALGPISGTHINPAVTIAMMSVKKISAKDGTIYVVCQLVAAGVAFYAGNMILGTDLNLAIGDGLRIGLAEAMGAAILVLGVSSVVYKNTPADAAGLTIGTSLALGAMLASAGSNGIVNPAVAIGLGSVSITYLLGPIVGGLGAVWLYQWLAE